MDELHTALEQMGERLNQDVIIVDVRTPEEFSEGHVPGAKNFPLDQLDRHVNEIKKFKEVYIYCKSGGRVGAAKQFLEGSGITEMNCVLAGGFPNWAAWGFEIEFD